MNCNITRRSYKTFPIAFRWIQENSLHSEGTAIEFFGRRRKFDEHEFYKSRNFLVQAPASIICLRKLVKLHQSMQGLGKLIFHLHDGYGVLMNKTIRWQNNCSAAKEVLESPDDLFAGLKLKVSTKVGGSLNNMQLLEK